MSSLTINEWDLAKAMADHFDYVTPMQVVEYRNVDNRVFVKQHGVTVEAWRIINKQFEDTWRVEREVYGFPNAEAKTYLSTPMKKGLMPHVTHLKDHVHQLLRMTNA